MFKQAVVRMQCFSVLNSITQQYSVKCNAVNLTIIFCFANMFSINYSIWISLTEKDLLVDIMTKLLRTKEFS